MSTSYTNPKQNRYKTDYEDFRGLFVIINNKTFQRSGTLCSLPASQIDVEKLQSTFRPLGFEFQIFQDCTTVEMKQIMIDVKKSNLKDYDCLAVAIMTHGAHQDMIWGSGPGNDCISLDILLGPLKEITGEKPKIIIIEACRGDKADEGRFVAATDDVTDIYKIQPNFKVPMEADFLYYFSTSPGYYSYISIWRGSLFIQSLCRVTEQHFAAFDEIDVLKLLTRVNRQIADEFKVIHPKGPRHDLKQMPSIVSMLRKDLYFIKN